MNMRAELSRTFPLRWSMQRRFRVPTREVGEPYYIQWSGAPPPIGEGWDDAAFDGEGLICKGTFPNPVSISQYALSQYDSASSGYACAKKRFLRHARWLRDHQRNDGGYPYPIPLPAYGVEPGWLSAMAQGEAASVLLRAYALESDPSYLEAGLNSLEPLARDVCEGGALFVRGSRVVFEEVASPQPSHILNGHLYASFALWEYVEHRFVRKELAQLHNDAVNSLARHVHEYDANGWSYYDLTADERGVRHEAPLWYHQFHIAQLHVYAAMTGNELFESFSRRWQASLDSPLARARVWNYGFYRTASALNRRVLGLKAPAFRTL